jgi:hypothetical protein
VETATAPDCRRDLYERVGSPSPEGRSGNARSLAPILVPLPAGMASWPEVTRPHRRRPEVAINSANCASAMAASARAEVGLEAAERLGDAVSGFDRAWHITGCGTKSNLRSTTETGSQRAQTLDCSSRHQSASVGIKQQVLLLIKIGKTLEK